jgi:hypothetical protein
MRASVQPRWDWPVRAVTGEPAVSAWAARPRTATVGARRVNASSVSRGETRMAGGWAGAGAGTRPGARGRRFRGLDVSGGGVQFPEQVNGRAVSANRR